MWEIAIFYKNEKNLLYAVKMNPTSWSSHQASWKKIKKTPRSLEKSIDKSQNL